jgi:hypothetical protein
VQNLQPSTSQRGERRGTGHQLDPWTQEATVTQDRDTACSRRQIDSTNPIQSNPPESNHHPPGSSPLLRDHTPTSRLPWSPTTPHPRLAEGDNTAGSELLRKSRRCRCYQLTMATRAGVAAASVRAPKLASTGACGIASTSKRLAPG